jgi:predicted KAP-like P-loop ATPase
LAAREEKRHFAGKKSNQNAIISAVADNDSRFDPRANIDAEIQGINDDRLGRAPFARRVAERIGGAGNRPSIVYGLAGPWGGGKSSVLNMIEELLKVDTRAKWEVVRFTPWAATDVESLTDEFYRAIAQAMPHDKEGKAARRLLLAATPVVIAGAKAAVKALIEAKIGKGSVSDILEASSDAAADAAGDFKVDQDPFVERFSKLSNAIKSANRNILVIVDDIDRLHTDELLSVMKAVRLLGRFDHVHYFLSYDENTVLDVLQGSELARKDRERARLYLEKIVQYPFALPPLDPIHLEAELTNALNAVATSHELDLGADALGGGGPIATIIYSIPDLDLEDLTPRFVYRFASQLDTLLSLVGKTELDFVDAALITYLRMKYQPVYKSLPRWRSDLVGTAHPEGHSEIGRDDWLKRIGDCLEPNSTRTASIVRFLGRMFPRLAQPNASKLAPRERPISDPDYFDRYFAYGIPVRDTPDEVFRAELTALLQSGSFPSDSVILAKFDDRLIRRKCLRNLDVVTAASSSMAATAAHYLADMLRPDDYDVDAWGGVVYGLVAQAISSAENDAAARKVVDTFRVKVGLLPTVRILSYTLPMIALGRSELVDASRSIREDVLALCEEDLTSDVIARDGADALTILDFAEYLDADLWAEIRQFAHRLIKQRNAQPYELAARFVRIRDRADSGAWERRSYLEYFKDVVPEDDWEVHRIPFNDDGEPFGDGDIVIGNPSLENRERFAALLLRGAPAGPSSGVADDAWSYGRVEHPDEGNPWMIEAIRGSTFEFRLHNRMPTPKYGIKMTGEELQQSDVGDIGAYGYIKFDAVQGTERLNRLVTISWHQREDRSDERGSRLGELPRV